MLARPCKILEIGYGSDDIRSFHLNYGEPVKAGQFVVAWLPGVSENPFSVSYNNNGKFGITVKRMHHKPCEEKTMTEAMFDLRPGDNVFLKPNPRSKEHSMLHGNGFLDVRPPGKINYLVAGGIGAAPLALLAKEIDDTNLNADVSVMIGAADFKEMDIFIGRFNRHAHALWIATDNDSAGYHGFVTDLIGKLSFSEEESIAYVCGNDAMMDAAAKKFVAHGVPEENVVLCTESYMKCYAGLCGGCERDGWRVCVDGPVFTYDVIKNGLREKRDACGTRIKTF
ncbi:MAG: hypothetical protein ABIG30_02215 [Candidatus Aenigmatarchaeota archaeon]